MLLKDIVHVRYRMPGEAKVKNFIGREDESTFNEQMYFCLCAFNGFKPIRYASAKLNEGEKALLANKTEFIGNQQEALIYLDYVKQCLEQIAQSIATKVVPARTKFYEIANPDMDSAFDYLLAKNPAAFVYHLQSARFGTWLGATPELLLYQKNNSVETVSLAGTLGPENAHFNQKERDEQQIVTDYIKVVMHEAGGQLTQIGDAQPLIANRVTHLQTRLTFHFNETPSPDNLAIRLHPTPAVCGFPKDVATNFINDKETDRSLYSGYIGTMSRNESQLFVNLRCGRVYSNGVLLYAGAGVVNGSVPAKELEETERKMQTIGSAFGLSI